MVLHRRLSWFAPMFIETEPLDDGPLLRVSAPQDRDVSTTGGSNMKSHRRIPYAGSPTPGACHDRADRAANDDRLATVGEVPFDTTRSAGHRLPVARRARRRPADLAARAVRVLREAAGSFASLVGPMGLTGLVLDADANVVYANPMLLDLTGWDADEVFGEPWFDRFVDQPCGPIKEAFAAVLAGDPAFAVCTIDVRKRDGTRCRIRWHNALVRDGDRAVGTASIGEILDDEDPADAGVGPTSDFEPAGIVALARALVARPEEASLRFVRLVAEHCAQLAEECGRAADGPGAARHIRLMFGLLDEASD